MFKGRAPVWANKAREDDPQQYIWLFDIKEQPVCPQGRAALLCHSHCCEVKKNNIDSTLKVTSKILFFLS